MDNPRPQPHRADGIRRRADGARPAKEKIFYPAEEKIKIPAAPKKPSSPPPSPPQLPAPALPPKKEKPIIRDRLLAQEIKEQPLFLKKRNIVAVSTGIGITLLFVLLLSTIFARVTITVKPSVEDLQIQDMAATFDASVSEVNQASRVIPAELLSFTNTASSDFDATGNDYVQQKAAGTVRIYNAFNTSPQGLVTSTRFITDSGILFRLVKGVTVPGASTEGGKIIPQYIEAHLTADVPGEESNIGGTIKLLIPGFKGTPKYDGFYAIATAGFTGGSKGQSRVITKEDIASAQEKITKKVFDDLKDTMVRKIPANFTYAESLSEIQITNISIPKEKTKADHFTAQANAVAHALVFRQDDVLSFLRGILLQGDASRDFIQQSADLHYRIKNTNYDKKQVQAGISGAIKTKKIIQKDELANAVKGQKEGSLIETLKQRREIATFKVSFFPPWMYSAPSRQNQINIIVEDPIIEAKKK